MEKNFFAIMRRGNSELTPPEFPQLSPKAERLMQLLWERARGGVVEISQVELSKLTGWHRATVWRYLQEARDAGVITWERRRRDVNLYRFLDVAIVRHQASHKRFLPWPLRRRSEKLRKPSDLPSPRHVHVNLEGDSANGGPPPGRELELAEVERLAAKGANTLILGWEGYGKTELLRYLSRNGIQRGTPCDELIHLSTPSPPKEFLINLGRELHRRGDLGLDLDPEQDPYHDLEKLKLLPLFRLIRDSFAHSKRRYLILVDDLDQITPRQKRQVEELLELPQVQMIATAKSQKPSLASLWHHFFPVELDRLPQEVSDKIVDSFIQERAIPVADPRWREEKGLAILKERLYRKSRGNPRRLLTLLRKIELHGYVDRAYLEEELGAEKDEPIYDMTWFIIMTAAIIMAARYLGLGLHDRELYILAGVSYGAMILIRWLSYRWRR